MAIPVPPKQGPFTDVPNGDPVMDIQVLEPFDDRDEQGGSRKKNKNDKNDNDKEGTKPSRPLYEGYVLERIKSSAGETLSWRKCGRRSLPCSQDELVSLVKKHRKDTRTNSASADFKRLSTDKQGIINRIIEEKRLYEKSMTAEWTLIDVQTVDRRVGWSSKETVRLQIVIKRTDKGSDKNGYAATGTHSYAVEDVIDLFVPLVKKKDKGKDKDKNKNKIKSDNNDPLDNPINMDFGPKDLPPDNHHDGPQYHDQHQHWDQPGPNHPPPEAPFAPDWQQQQNPFNPHPQFHADPQANFAGGARDFGNPTPFYPQNHVAAPGHYDEPLDAREYIHPHQGARARTRSTDRDRHRERSRSQRRRSVARRPSRRRDSRRREDSVEDMRHKFDRMYRDDRDSNSSNYDERSMWSRSDGRYSRSPDTSVNSEDYVPRNKSRPYHRDSDPRPRYRSTRYRDTEIEPAYTHHGRDRRHAYREQDRRPGLPHAITYDDYPQGRGAEPRYLPAPPMQRRNIEVFGDKRGDHFDRDCRDWRQPVDREHDAFEARMRAARRQSYYP